MGRSSSGNESSVELCQSTCPSVSNLSYDRVREGKTGGKTRGYNFLGFSGKTGKYPRVFTGPLYSLERQKYTSLEH